MVETARHVDRLLSVDLSYRYTDGMRQIRDLIASGELGTVFAVDLTFHNAYGPSKPWFYDKALSGGGCVIDLGVHLVDLLLWVLGFPDVARVESRLFAKVCPSAATATRSRITRSLQSNWPTAFSPGSHAHGICRPDAMR